MMHVLKFLAVIWSLLCLAGFMLPFVDSAGMSAGNAFRVAMLGANTTYCFVAWALGLVALAALRVIFTDDAEPVQRSRVEPGV